MYQAGKLVMYGVHGICRIVDREERRIDRKTVPYLVLEPVDQPGSRFLVPSGNPAAMAKLRPLLTASELEDLLSSDAVRQYNWIPDENRRKQFYREALSGGDRTVLLQTVHTLCLRRAALQEQGRRLHICDDSFLRDAQRLLRAEFSIVWNVSPAEAEAHILQKLQGAEL